VTCFHRTFCSANSDVNRCKTARPSRNVATPWPGIHTLLSRRTLVSVIPPAHFTTYCCICFITLVKQMGRLQIGHVWALGHSLAVISMHMVTGSGDRGLLLTPTACNTPLLRTHDNKFYLFLKASAHAVSRYLRYTTRLNQYLGTNRPFNTIYVLGNKM